MSKITIEHMDHMDHSTKRMIIGNHMWNVEMTHTITKKNPAKLLLGMNLCSWFDILKPNIRLSVYKNQENQSSDRKLIKEF